MAFDPRQTLRDAGVLSSSTRPEIEEAFATLTREETDLLVSLKSRLPAVLPEVMAHSGDGQWTTPEVEAHDLDAAASCLCGAWSGSGSGAN
ncbi:StsA-related sactipeptide RiPP [Sphaerisporangium corydalis]|uniref:StsA-related sactipeptide RiPP n=1 Tax=Sphaerisporangium corydalis TaxID=1441875 RepID=A0ABV9E9D8_9ACTN|nr:StsA-related sactipeptide RiPP [Sphaerisporangium corydalis]